uniref:Alpha-carbonic anhydrase domain-containing protein n=1 Tax=Cacopsylla melanoneura TaxID=428564 RepID=A0A8D9ABG7_9HEMI
MSLVCSSSTKRENFVKNYSPPRCFFSSSRGHVSRSTRLCQILVVFLFCVHFSECHPWKYDSDEDDGDKDWKGLCDSGRRQSPVDLTKRNCVTTSRIEPIAFIHYNRPVATNVTNNGHTENDRRQPHPGSSDRLAR